MPIQELDVSKEEWDIAKKMHRKHLDKHPEEDNYKISRKKHPDLKHSFIVMNGEIYAVELNHYYAYGHYSRVKRVVDEKENLYILQISPSHMRNVDHELESLNRTGLLLGHFKAHRGNHHSFWRESGQYVHNKDYTLMKFVPGVPLSKIKLPRTVTYQPIYILLAIRLIQELKRLHQLKIIHNQIRPENILVESSKDDLVVRFVGFGESYAMHGDEQEVDVEEYGKEIRYTAPEKAKEKKASYSADIYAVMLIISSDIGVRPISVMKSTMTNINIRPSMDEVLDDLWCILSDLTPEDQLSDVPISKNHEKFTNSYYHHPELRHHSHLQLHFHRHRNHHGNGEARDKDEGAVHHHSRPKFFKRLGCCVGVKEEDASETKEKHKSKKNKHR